jgi:hypothetical protein
MRGPCLPVRALESRRASVCIERRSPRLARERELLERHALVLRGREEALARGLGAGERSLVRRARRGDGDNGARRVVDSRVGPDPSDEEEDGQDESERLLALRRLDLFHLDVRGHRLPPVLLSHVCYIAELR